MTNTYYNVNVVEIGSDASLMLEEKMVILFNNTVPEDLRSIAFVHDGGELTDEIKAGDQLVIDGDTFDILFVGDKVNETMRDLGHATFHFNGETISDLPGTVCLEDKSIPQISENSTISFNRPR
ncbi:PTS system, glucitol/sorbitol-specific IIA component [Lentibacillus halodurans]|uniref:PTS system, glucitol/sorbitol-specific IIA component n=1 Tax=Lentibacillus halodurans TaxID=237679 RepID=A0A1I0XHD3_9BACI|nr:PTS glucitol/sorbitol transporter subunit IIA [Lentibacillus halodurans]SFB00324.1 PTS system, glucitol/sorbitol-specific IIA component [Lentibacillus halodurans]